MLPSPAPHPEATDDAAPADPPVELEDAGFEDVLLDFLVAFVCLVGSAYLASRSFYWRMTTGPYDIAYRLPTVVDTPEPPKSDSSATTDSSESAWSDVSRATDGSEESNTSDIDGKIESRPPSATSSSNASQAVTHGTHECVLLVTTTATVEQRTDIGRARDILNALGVSFYEVNAAYASRKIVNRFKKASGLSSVYPQLFVVRRRAAVVEDEEAPVSGERKKGPASGYAAGGSAVLFIPFKKLEDMALHGRFDMPELNPAPPSVLA